MPRGAATQTPVRTTGGTRLIMMLGASGLACNFIDKLLKAWSVGALQNVNFVKSERPRWPKNPLKTQLGPSEGADGILRSVPTTGSLI